MGTYTYKLDPVDTIYEHKVDHLAFQFYHSVKVTLDHQIPSLIQDFLLTCP